MRQDHPHAILVDDEYMEKLRALTGNSDTAERKPRKHYKYTVDWRKLLKGRTDLLKADELKKLRSIQERYKKLLKQGEEVGINRPKQVIDELQKAHRENPTAENLKKLMETDEETLKARFAQARQALRSAKDDLTAEAAPIRQTFLQHAHDVILEEIAMLHGQEEKTAERLSIPFEPSESLGALMSALQQIDTEMADPGYSPLASVECLLGE